MNTTACRGLWGVAIAAALLAIEIPAAQGQAGAIATTLVTNAGTLNDGDDHFIDVAVNGTLPLEQVQVVCVTLHGFSTANVFYEASGAPIPASIAYGDKNFTVTFDEPVDPGIAVRIVMEDFRVRGRKSGLTIPYQVFATHSTLDESIPIGTALISIPESTGR